MNNHPNQPSDDAIITALLEDYPLAPLPAGLMDGVLAQIQPEPEPFRLHFIDVFIPFLIAMVVGLALLLWYNMTGRMEIEWLPNVGSLSGMGGFSAESTGRALLIAFAEIILGLAFYFGFMDDRPHLLS